MCILLDWSSLWFKVNGKTRYSKSGDCEIFIILPHPDHIKLSDRDNIFWQIVGKYWQTCVSLVWRFYMLESLFALPSFNILSNKKFYFHLQTWIIVSLTMKANKSTIPTSSPGKVPENPKECTVPHLCEMDSPTRTQKSIPVADN